MKMLIVLTILSFMLFGCSQIDYEPNVELDQLTNETVTLENISLFVTLGDYRGIEFDFVQTQIVTEEHVNEFISENFVYEELTDEFLNTYLDIESVEQFRNMVKERLEQEAHLAAENNMRRQVWLDVLENATVLSYPLMELEFAADRILFQFREAAMTHNSEIESFIEEAFGIEYHDFLNNYIRPDAFIDVEQDLVIRAVAAAEGITVTEEEIRAEITRFTEEFEFESELEFLHFIGGEGRVWIALLADRVIDVLMEYAVMRG